MGERVDDDDELLGLSLGLGSGHPEKNRRRSSASASASAPRSPSLELNLSLTGHARSNPPENSQAHRRHPISCNLQLRHSEVNLDPRPPFNSGVGFDVNGAPLPHLPFPEDDNAASSPNSTLSSISAGKRVEREVAGDNDNEGERTSCSRGSDEDDGGGGGGGGDGEGRKKLRLSREQSMVLEETFKAHSTLNPKQKLALAEKLNLRPRQVEVWFQNRRARTKLKQTEVDCEYLKRCCENLTQENRRLQKEVQELRALKLSPHLYMHLNPPTTLTMCPSCERVAALSTSSSSYAPAAANLPPGS